MTQLQTPNHSSSVAEEVGAKYATTNSFLTGGNDQSLTPVDSETNASKADKREPLRHLLIGTAKAVMSTIHVLHQLGYADVSDWSPLMPTGNPGEVMSILVRSILVQ
jgi:hypothetical protein